MTTGTFYSAGTVSVTNGSTAVVGVGTGFTTWGAAFGDEFVIAGLKGSIASVGDNFNLVLLQGWPGPTAAGTIYMLERRGGAVAVLDNQQKLSDLIDLMVDGYVGNEIASALVKAAIVDADALGVIDSDDNWEFKTDYPCCPVGLDSS